MEVWKICLTRKFLPEIFPLFSVEIFFLFLLFSSWQNSIIFFHKISFLLFQIMSENLAVENFTTELFI